MPTDGFERSRPALLAGLGAGLVCLAVLWFFGQGLPLYFEDIPFVQGAVDRTWTSLLLDVANPLGVGASAGYAPDERALELLLLKAVHAVAGFQPWPYHLLKSLCLALIAGLAGYGSTRVGAGPGFALLLGLALPAAPPVLQSTLWVADFDLVAQLLVALALALQAALLAEHPAWAKRRWFTTAGVLVLGLLAVQAKASALVLAPALLIGALLLGRRHLARTSALVAALVALTLAPRLLAAGGTIEQRWQPEQLGALVDQVGRGFGLLPILFGLGGCVAIAASERLARRLAGQERIGGLRAVAATLAGWTASAPLMWPLLPSPETRYLSGVLVPAIAATCFAGAMLARLAAGGRAIAALRACLAALLLALCVVPGLRLDVHFRGSWGSLFVALDEVSRTIEAEQRDTVVLYRYWRPMMYTTEPERNNAFVLLEQGELDRAGIGRRPGGLEVPDHWSQVARLTLGRRPRSPGPGLREFEGTTGSLFDRVVGRAGWQLTWVDLITMELVPGPPAWPQRVWVEVRPAR
jgi:hypothetical protein